MDLKTFDRGGGVILSPLDIRDYSIYAAMELPVGASLAKDLDLPDEYEVWTPPVENQQGESCVAQTISAIMECVDHNLGLEHRDYSIGFIYGNRRYKNDWKSAGMIPRNACANTVEYGDVYKKVWEDEREWYYVIDAFEKIYDSIADQADKPFSKYVTMYTLDEIKAFIYKYKIPIAASFPTKEISRAAGDGNHMVLIYGWTKDNKLKFQNSWGPFIPRGTLNISEMNEAKGLVPKEIYFDDVDQDLWSVEDIELVAQKGIMLGYPDNTFMPDKQITRREAAVICGRILKEAKKSFKK